MKGLLLLGSLYRIEHIHTALRHHALLHLRGLGLAHGPIRWSHLNHPVPLFHPHPTGGAAFLPLTPFCYYTAAWLCKNNRNKALLVFFNCN